MQSEGQTVNTNLSSDAMPARRWMRTTMLALAVLVGVIVVVALGAGSAAAQGGGEFELPPGVTWDDVNGVASKMYCDVCEGIPLDECESVACRQWREEIARQLSDGRTEDEIIDYFVERYGEDVSAIPRDETDRFIAFAVPVILALLLAVTGGVQVLRYRQRGQQSGQVVRRSSGGLRKRPVPDDLDPALIERLERELEGLE